MNDRKRRVNDHNANEIIWGKGINIYYYLISHITHHDNKKLLLF
jgi:hypothetical protein